MNWTEIITKLVPSFFSVVIAWITYKQVTETSDMEKNSDELAEMKKKNDHLEGKVKKLQIKNRLLKLQVESLEEDSEAEKAQIIQYKQKTQELRKRLNKYESSQ
jgi:septal ring factor EnvC (AmiA/AmiB activator)